MGAEALSAALSSLGGGVLLGWALLRGASFPAEMEEITLQGNFALGDLSALETVTARQLSISE